MGSLWYNLSTNNISEYHGIICSRLCFGIKEFNDLVSNDSNENHKIVSLQPKEFPAVTYMWNNKIAYFTIEKKIIAVLIENRNIAQAQRAVFENLWKVAKKNIKPQPL